MTTAHTVLAVTLSLVFLPLGLAKISAVPFMRQAAARLGMSTGLYRVIGALEVAGAAGLWVGPASTPLGVAAAVVHLRHGDPPVQALPAAVLALTALAYTGAAIGVLSSTGAPRWHG
ncbi:DoxX family protein [Streptomyces sp. NPDC006422]|uniref:DoxX family protein n=1 Tax=unclassified Streptomyces TaxID=2593676 RepID=UPI0033BB35B4